MQKSPADAAADGRYSRSWRPERALDWCDLSLNRLAAPVRNAMASVYADVLFAEEFGVKMLERMVALAPEGNTRAFMREQAMDEAKHVEFFTRVMSELGGYREEPSRQLETLRLELARVEDFDELMLHAQVIETAARVIFVNNGIRTLRRLETSLRLPGSQGVARLLQAVVHLIGRDESRHIAFGLRYLRGSVERLDVHQRHRLEERVCLSARLMHESFAARSSEFGRLGWPPAEVLDCTWDAMRSQLARLELEIGDPSGKLPERP